MLTIGEVARQAGLRPSAIRYYERVGLIPEPLRVGGQRRYERAVFTRIAIVRMAQDAGFTLDEIRTLVSGFPDATPAGDRWREMSRRKLPEVDAMILRLVSMRRVLEESLGCDCLTLDTCGAQGWSNASTAPMPTDSSGYR